jgi:hypothetical protein
VNPVQQAPAPGQAQQGRLYIGGEWVEPADGRMVDVINPLIQQ